MSFREDCEFPKTVGQILCVLVLISIHQFPKAVYAPCLTTPLPI